jgi:putative transcriptional regulator
MPIRITLDAALARRGVKGKELAARIGVSETQMSLFRSGKVRGIRFSTLAKMCAVLGCKPGELLDYEFENGDLAVRDEPGEAA